MREQVLLALEGVDRVEGMGGRRAVSGDSASHLYVHRPVNTYIRYVRTSIPEVTHRRILLEAEQAERDATEIAILTNRLSIIRAQRHDHIVVGVFSEPPLRRKL